MDVPLPKPIINLTKKSFTSVCEYIRTVNPEQADVLIPLMTEAFKMKTGFDINEKTPKELVEKQTRRRNKMLEEEGTNEYQKYKKTRYEKLKQQYPNIPARMFFTHSIADIKKMAGENA